MRRDWGGVVIGVGMLLIGLWTLSEVPESRRWTSLLTVVFGGWFAWHQWRDRLDRTALDLRNAPDTYEPVPDDVADVTETQGVPGLCCFCGDGIARESDDWGHLTITHKGDESRWQLWYCHGSCFKQRLARAADVTDLFDPYFF